MKRPRYEYAVTMVVIADSPDEQKVKHEVKLLIDRGITEKMADHIMQAKFVKAKSSKKQQNKTIREK